MKQNDLLNNININKTWDHFIKNEYILSIINNIYEYLLSYYDIEDNYNVNNINKLFFPYKKNIFRFFENDISKTKYIILGMDPYSSYYINNNKIIPVATGRSFEVSNINSFISKYKQTSLMNIYKSLYFNKFNQKININQMRNNTIEINDNVLINDLKKIINKQNKNDLIEYIKKHINYEENKLYVFDVKSFFDLTEKQGVIWLNAILTVEANKPNSHENIWKDFMDELIKFIINNYDIKWVVWGNVAKNRIIKYTNNIIYSCHPASRVKNDFVENNSFKYMEDILLYI